MHNKLHSDDKAEEAESDDCCVIIRPKQVVTGNAATSGVSKDSQRDTKADKVGDGCSNCCIIFLSKKVKIETTSTCEIPDKLQTNIKLKAALMIAA